MFVVGKCLGLNNFYFFFSSRRRHTRCLSDWSSDVCSSDLVGANVLVGGFDRSITLQPVSSEGSTGLNVAAGIGAISLKYAECFEVVTLACKSRAAQTAGLLIERNPTLRLSESHDLIVQALSSLVTLAIP